MLILVVCACGCAAQTRPEREREPLSRPNIIFVLADDARWDTLGCAGHPFIKTPNLDRIAREGARFTNYFVTIPLCSPSRACILTGQYAHKHGITDNQSHNNEKSHQIPSVAPLLQRAGYETAFIGKWHMGDDPKPRPGWDRWVAMPGHGVYVDCPLNEDGKDIRPQGYLTDVLGQFAVDFIRKKHEKPYVLFVGEKACHDPTLPAPRHQKLYADQPIEHAPSVNDDLSGKPVLRDRRKLIKEGETPPSDEKIRNQLRTLAAVDESVGEMLKALEQTGQLEQTVFIYTSDNGYFWGEHQLGDKRAAYDEAIRDPLLIRYPPLIKAGTLIPQLMLNIDIAPTFLELAGAPAPPECQGRSWLPLLRDGNAPWRTDFLAEYFFEDNHPYIPSWQALRSDEWKLIHYTTVNDVDELYHLKTDPYEMKNLINDPAAKVQLEQLRRRLDELVVATK
jgi:N-acetylglucosamine-6-sulfatase